jgi:uncharacterized protein YbaP (TraB family)
MPVSSGSLAQRPTDSPEALMRALATKKKTRLYHAKMLVTRAEEWCVEAESAEEARVLLNAGAGHRCTPGDSLHIELDQLIDE